MLMDVPENISFEELEKTAEDRELWKRLAPSLTPSPTTQCTTQCTTQHRTAPLTPTQYRTETGTTTTNWNGAGYWFGTGFDAVWIGPPAPHTHTPTNPLTHLTHSPSYQLTHTPAHAQKHARTHARTHQRHMHTFRDMGKLRATKGMGSGLLVEGIA